MAKSNSKGTAVVTGASSGIGAVYAERLARRGFDLLLVARDGERLRNLAASLSRETGVTVDVLRADLTEKDDVAKVEARLGSDAAIALLINNAGVGLAGGLTATDPDALEKMVLLNVLAVARLGTAAAKAFAARGKGAIVNIASVLALMPERFNGGYTASKAFVLNFSQALESELKGTGVQVQAVLPNATRTEIFERAGMNIEKYDPSQIMEAGDLVDAALAGFDAGEPVTIPALKDETQWTAFEAARTALAPNLSSNRPAARYREAVIA